MANRGLAKNEELFRKVNERIDDLSASVDRDDRQMEFLCECDREDCHEKINVTRAQYEAVRAVPTHFIVVPGHEDPSVERVAYSTERFFVVEKQGEAAEDAVETDPRSAT
ncbi:MAG TPA: hypothetical protein VGH82_06040 [Gaiellaceae bacterium]|jgi:hypothetical protein